MNKKVKINWKEYIKWSQKHTMRASASDGSNFPEVVEVLYHNDDGTITVLIGYSDSGTRLVTHIYPESEFVTEILDSEPETETTYEITSELFGNSEPTTITEVTQMVAEWESDGWTYEVEESDNELRLYAYRDASEERSPSVYTMWQMVTDDYGYIIIGEELS